MGLCPPFNWIGEKCGGKKVSESVPRFRSDLIFLTQRIIKKTVVVFNKFVSEIGGHEDVSFVWWQTNARYVNGLPGHLGRWVMALATRWLVCTEWATRWADGTTIFTDFPSILTDIGQKLVMEIFGLFCIFSSAFGEISSQMMIDWRRTLTNWILESDPKRKTKSKNILLRKTVDNETHNLLFYSGDRFELIPQTQITWGTITRKKWKKEQKGKQLGEMVGIVLNLRNLQNLYHLSTENLMKGMKF